MEEIAAAATVTKPILYRTVGDRAALVNALSEAMIDRISTAIGMLDRHGVIAGPRPPNCFDVTAPLPPNFLDDEQLSEKKRRDQQRLYAMVQFAAETGDRKAFLNRYFLGDE